MPLEIVRNDITKMAVDAIVNPTNELLRGGSGGTDGCIHRAAGPQLLEECRMLGGCRTGDAKITKGYKLPCRYVIHTVGPVWHGGGHGEREKLISCYRKSLELAKKYGCETVACPIISSGSYGYPKEEALRIAADTIGAFLEENEMSVYIVVFDKTVFKISSELFTDIAEYIDDNYVDAFAKARRERRRQLPWQRNYDVLENMPPLRESYESVPMPCAAAQSPLPTDEIGLGEMLKKLDTGFSETLLKLIDRTGKKDSEIYKKANVDRKLFSKIRNNPDYKPSKATAIAFAIALELDIEETRDLISRAGYALTHSSKFDVIIEYFIKRGQYDIIIINEALFAFDQSLLGA